MACLCPDDCIRKLNLLIVGYFQLIYFDLLIGGSSSNVSNLIENFIYDLIS